MKAPYCIEKKWLLNAHGVGKNIPLQKVIGQAEGIRVYTARNARHGYEHKDMKTKRRNLR